VRAGPERVGPPAWVGVLVALGAVGAVSGAMLPLRGTLSTATFGLVLVVPVVLAVVVGGFVPGVLAVAAGFVAFDFFFIPPYQTLAVTADQDWVALGVYATVMIVVARTVAGLRTARREAARRAEDARRLADFAGALVEEVDRPELAALLAREARRLLDLTSAVLLLPGPGRGRLVVAAEVGAPLEGAVAGWVASLTGEATGVVRVGPSGARAAVLATPRGLEGVLVVVPGPRGLDDNLLAAFVGQASSALERARLRREALRAEVLEEANRWRQALLHSVSHDLRTPLAALQVAAGSLTRPDDALSPAERGELAETIEAESRRLSRLITNLLDMTRIEAGALQARLEPVDVAEVCDEVLERPEHRLAGPWRVLLPDDLPLVQADPVLLGQALANLLDNARRAAGRSGLVEIGASLPDHGGRDGVAGRGVRGGCRGDPLRADGMFAAANAASAAERATGGRERPSGSRSGEGTTAPGRTRGGPSEAGGEPPEWPGGPFLELWVRDRGPGLPASLEDAALFRPFAHVAGRSDTRREGVGLGLAIVAAFVEAQRGRVTVTNRPGGGVEARLFLPLASVDALAAVPE